MVDYDTACTVVQDPNADPIMLAKIAYENPEFGANVAVNPRAYPGLIRWIAQFGDERARETCAQLGYTAVGGPIVDQEAPDDQVASETSVEQSFADQAQVQAQPTNPYGFTEQMAKTTQDPMQMQQIAQYAPELLVPLATNPYLYPELVNWLASIGDPAINAALSQRQIFMLLL